MATKHEEIVPKRFYCEFCGARCPKPFMIKGGFGKRQAWMRRHKQRKHPELKSRTLDQALKQSEAEKE